MEYLRKNSDDSCEANHNMDSIDSDEFENIDVMKDGVIVDSY